jgi:ubiquinone/menaquinone biosynthesis C-methylase UbiE/glycosyltransferase involved in cell wall biosynthesis
MEERGLNLQPFDEEKKEATVSNNVERVGLGIGIITRGWTSIKWMMHMEHLRKSFSIGMFWKYLIVEGRGWADARNEVIKKAKAHNFEWVMFIDDDVFIPDDCMNALMSTGKKIICGMYWTKTDPARPVIFKRMGEGPWDNFPIDKEVEIAGSGLGCCLIHMSVFEKFDEANIPYFMENWVYIDPAGQQMKCPVGEDHYFFTKAKELGFQPYCHTGVLCDHYDFKTKRFFPPEKVVRELTERKLKEEGREDLIVLHKKALGGDPNKKTVVFFNATSSVFNGNELEKNPVGGAETCLINISQLLANKHNFNVHVICRCPEQGIYNNVYYHNIDTMAVEDISQFNPDLFVVMRNVDLFTRYDFHKLGAKKVVLWAHDMAKDPVWKGINEVLPKIDNIIALSDWHKEDIIKTHNLPANTDKIVILRNGINPNFFNLVTSKVKGQCIYSSTPYRGLDILVELWPKIKEQVPHATLKIYSSMLLYGAAYDDSQYAYLYNQAKNMKGVFYYPSIRQDKLAKEMLASELLVYPNTFDETGCITAMEAIAAGTPVVTSAKAALNETVPDSCGVKIAGNPYSAEYKKAFQDAVVDLLKNESKWAEKHRACMGIDNAWNKRSLEWVNLFFPEMHQEEPVVNSPEYWDAVYNKEKIKYNQDVRENKDREEIIFQHIKEGDKVLDIGCGMGGFTRAVRKRFPKNEIWGTDISHEAIDFCRETDRSIFYANHPVENTDNFEQHYFDLITIQHVLEHFEDIESIIIKMRKLVKLNGKIIIVLPIDDYEWKEHPKVWQMTDVYSMVGKYFPTDKVAVQTLADPTRRYKDNKMFVEAVVIIELGGK